jgi:LPXTG-site transpeptidase (sortase) family protein
MGRLRNVLALSFVLAGSVALAYPALAYATDAQRSRHLTESVEAMLAASKTSTAAESSAGRGRASDAAADPGPSGGGAKHGSSNRAKPILNVPAPHDGQALGVIQIPSIGLRTVFLQGTADATLLTGPGHLPWTSMPGTGGISVLAAHRDLQFADLHDVRSGDRIWLQLPSGALGYKVVGARVTTPDDTSIYAPAPDHPTELRLLTCWPPAFVGPAPDRLVVSAVPLRADIAAAPTKQGSTSVAATEAATPSSGQRAMPSLALPSAPSVPETELLPLFGALGVGLASLAVIAAVQGSRRRAWFFAFLTGVVALNLAVIPALGG